MHPIERRLVRFQVYLIGQRDHNTLLGFRADHRPINGVFDGNKSAARELELGIGPTKPGYGNNS